jgi:hypothetical protein
MIERKDAAAAAPHVGDETDPFRPGRRRDGDELARPDVIGWQHLR